MKQTENVKKKRGVFRIIFALFGFTILVVAGIGIYLYYWYTDAIFKPPGDSSDYASIEVTEGTTLISLLPELSQNGLIKSEEAVRIYIRLNQTPANIKYGNYKISKGLTVPELINVLEKGVLKPSVTVTIKEGLRLSQIVSVISQSLPSNSNFSITEFNTITSTPDIINFTPKVKDFLILHKPTGANLEGYIFPDTYYFNEDQTTQEIVEQIITNLIDKLSASTDLANLNLNQNEVRNLYQALTLGSIIERESSASDDRKEISGVFHNRLIDDYLLESDATVNFITGKNDPGIKLVDKEIDSPYNTYKYTGLPPGPICSPSLSSILAAFYPNTTRNYFFFHNSKGETYYSETYAEHLRKLSLYMN